MSNGAELDPDASSFGVSEFSKSCGIGTARLYNLIKCGRVPVVMVNGKKRITSTVAKSLLDEHGHWRGPIRDPASAVGFDGYPASVRTANCLRNSGIETVQGLREFVQKNGRKALLNTPNFGKVSMREVDAMLGREVIEVKITAQMLDAGIKAVVHHAHGPIAEMVAQIYAAMVSARSKRALS